MRHKILLVDDEANVLKALQRLLRRDAYELLLAHGGKEALDVLSQHDDLAVVISDQRMPEVSGAEVLRKAYELHPDAVRIALTGEADTESILQCINQARVSNVLLKPWDDDALKSVIKEAVEAHWIRLENERLEQLSRRQKQELAQLAKGLEEKVEQRTQELAEAKKRIESSLHDLSGVLADLMDLHAPGLRGHTRRVADMSRRLAEAIDLPPDQVAAAESAGLLHDLGKVALPPDILHKLPRNHTQEERDLVRRHPVIGSELLKDVARFSDVAQAVRHHHENIAGTGYPDGLKGEKIPLASRIIAVCDAYDRFRYPAGQSLMVSPSKAARFLEMAAGKRFDERLVTTFLAEDIPTYTEAGLTEVEISINHVLPGMRLTKDVVNAAGRPLLRRNIELTAENIEQLTNSAGFDPIISRIYVAKDSVPESVGEALKSEDETKPSATAGAAKQKTAEQSAQADHDRPLVIVVDDEQHIVNALRRELRWGGYDVEGFTQPAEALGHLRAEKDAFALITDFNMPGVRGDRLLAQVQQEFPELPCLVLTGHATRDNVVRLCRAAHIVRILTKPWDKEILLQTLDGLRSQLTPDT